VKGKDGPLQDSSPDEEGASDSPESESESLHLDVPWASSSSSSAPFGLGLGRRVHSAFVLLLSLG
jgi:hypothetical protein